MLVYATNEKTKKEIIIMKKNETRITELYNLEHTMAKELMEEFEYPWEVLPNIGDYS